MWASRDHRSACQRENGINNGDSSFKAATWPSRLCLMSHGSFKTNLILWPSLLAEWQSQKGLHAPCVSALAEWAISVSSSFATVSELATPTWCPFDEGLGWHLSVSGRPSVAPSISLADSRGPGASLTPSLQRTYATLPKLARGLSAAHFRAHDLQHTHPCCEPFTLVSARESWPGVVSRASHHHDNLDRLWHLLPTDSQSSSLLGHVSPSCLHPSPLPCPPLFCFSLRFIVNSCGLPTWLWDW